MLLKNKVILVIGAGGLLGREIVKSVISEGAKVVAADMDLNALRNLTNDFGVDAVIPIDADITKKDSILNVFARAEEKWKRIDGAVNTAYPRNKNYGRDAFEVTYEDFCENVSLHLGGYFLFMQCCAEYAKKKSYHFSLVNMLSVYGVVAPKFDIYKGTGMTMPVEYAAIKSALVHLNSYFTAYMKGTLFRVNSVSPGGLYDKQNEDFVRNYNAQCRSTGMLDKEDVVGSVNFLLSEQSKFICGQNLVVDDAFSI